MAFHYPNEPNDCPSGMGYAAVRRRKPDGTANVGGRWSEPFGSCDLFFEEGLDVWEVVYHDNKGDLPE